MPRPRNPNKARPLSALRSAEKQTRVPLGVGIAPPCLLKDERALWEELAASVAPGHLGPADRPLLELAVRLLAELRRDAATFNSSRLAQLRAALLNLGLAPIARQQILAQVAQVAQAPGGGRPKLARPEKQEGEEWERYVDQQYFQGE